MQPVAILLGLFGLLFFSFASAYYLRNRRIALEARERLRQASITDVDAVRPEGPPGRRPMEPGSREEEGIR